MLVAAAAGVLAKYPKDMAFALLYLLDPDQKTARLVGSAGLDEVEPRNIARHCDRRYRTERDPGRFPGSSRLSNWSWWKTSEVSLPLFRAGHGLSRPLPLSCLFAPT